jgi:hypothetical protein
MACEKAALNSHETAKNQGFCDRFSHRVKKVKKAVNVATR